jgi:Acyl-protein synthetase, LuxE
MGRWEALGAGRPRPEPPGPSLRVRAEIPGACGTIQRMVVEEVGRFIDHPGSEEAFRELALAAFAFGYERIEPFRALCDRRGATPATVSDWRQVPAVPAAAFRTLALAAAPAQEVFRSSGTSHGGEGGEEGARSVHHHPFPDLYRRVIDATFPAHCLPGGERAPLLSLIPPREQLPDSSLSFMIDHVLGRFGGAGNAVAIGPRGLEFPALRSWLSARQRDRRPGVILATAFALAQALERLDRTDLRFRLPPGTVVFETGGFKGRRRELSRAELLAAVEARLAVPGSQVVREYGMTELTSHCYTLALAGGDPDLFVPPPWMRVRILDPESLAEAPAGAPGLIAVFDLANLGSALHLLTEDLGSAEAGGFRLLGRAAGAELRGCSLAVEELGG